MTDTNRLRPSAPRTWCALRALTIDSRTESWVPALIYIITLGRFTVHSSTIATARVQPADARSIFTGKQETANPVEGSDSRLCNFSIWQ
jgi:hypothetical protein